MSTQENITIKIEKLRKKMIEIAQEKGLTDVESLAISQELDCLLNDYEKSKKENKVE